MMWLVGGGFVSSFISGITGMAGGTLLLSILLISYDPSTSIALHGLLQVFSNLSRVFLFIKSVSWKHVGLFSLLAIPGAILGAKLSVFFSPVLLKALLGIVLLYEALKRPKKTEEKAPPSSEKIFVSLGFVSGFLGMIIGATGPLLAPFFLGAGLVKERFVATKALCQFLVQIIKVILFAALLHFDYTQHSTEIILITIAIFLGTAAAKVSLSYVSEKIFVIVLKTILFVLGTKMLLSGLL